MARLYRTLRVLGIAVLFGLAFWFVDGMLNYYFYRAYLRFMIFETPRSLLDAVILRPPLHALFVRVSFLIVCIIGGLMVAGFVNRQKQAEENLRDSETRYRNLVELASIPIIVHSDEKLVYLNSEAVRVLGGESEEEFIGRSVLDFVHPDERDAVEERVKLTYKNNLKAKPTHERFVRLDGTVIDVEVLANFTEYKGNPSSQVAFRDITEWKRKEEQLSFQAMLLEQVRDSITATDLQGHITYMNRAARETVDRSMEEMQGQTVEIFGEDPARGATQGEIVESTLRDGEWRGIVVNYDRKGRESILDTRTWLVRDEHGNPTGMCGISTDITERKRAEEELYRRNRELVLLNQIIAASAMGQGLEAMMGTACRELARAFDLPIATVSLMDVEKSRMVVVTEYLAEGQPSEMGKPVQIDNNPMFRYLFVHKAPLVIKDVSNDPRTVAARERMSLWGIKSMLALPLVVRGEMVGCMALYSARSRQFSPEEINLAWSVSDQVAGVLARTRAEEERRLLEEQYFQAQKMEALGLLTGGIAHDFNNLLTAINGFAALMQYQLPEDSPLRESVDKILDSGERASRLVRQLLVFSSKQVTEFHVLDLNTVVNNMDSMLQRIIGEHIEMETILAPDLSWVKVDPAQIEQVIVNLVVNAIDAMPDGGKLTIETANAILDDDYIATHLRVNPGAYVMLAVSDTGIGMSEDVKERVFEPFFTTKGPGRGTGLGLSTVYGIIKQSGGHVWLYSEEGQGATFKVYLPRAESESAPPTALREDAEAPRGSETLLLVEDDPGVREVARRILARQGYSILVAGNGQEALSLAENYDGEIYLLVTDVVMPGMSGSALAEELIAMRPGLRVLFTSGYADNAIVQHGVLDASVYFIPKPFSADSLVRKVREILDSHHKG